MVDTGRLNERRAQITRGAARLFLEKGYEATTVREIAREVGLQSGSLFSHFGSKQEILVVVMDWGLRVALERADEALDGVAGARPRLLALSRAHLRTLLGEATEALAVSQYEWRSLSPESQREVVRLRDEYEDRWREVLQEAGDEGLTHAKDIRVFRLFALGALNGAVQWYRPGGEYEVDALAERFVAFVLGEEDESVEEIPV